MRTDDRKQKPGGAGCLLFVALGACFGGLPLVAQAVPATQEASSYRLIVRLHNYARVKPAVLSPAKHVAGDIFSAMGIELVWLDFPTTRAELANFPGSLWDPLGAVVDVNILPRSMTALAKLPRSVFGLTPMAHEGDRAAFASVYYDRIEQEVLFSPASTDQILGYVMAHELGHMLLRTTQHSSRGIMMAEWKFRFLQHAAQGLPRFTPQQAERIRAETAARGKAGQGGTGPQPPTTAVPASPALSDGR